jgi:hypothetical protein
LFFLQDGKMEYKTRTKPKKKVKLEDMTREDQNNPSKNHTLHPRPSAREQLNVDLQVLESILKMFGFQDLPPIKRMAASPQEIDEKVKKELESEKIDFFLIKKNSLESQQEEDFKQNGNLTESNLKRLIASFAFLSSIEIVERKKVIKELKIKESTQEGVKGRDITKNFDQQSGLNFISFHHSMSSF